MHAPLFWFSYVPIWKNKFILMVWEKVENVWIIAKLKAGVWFEVGFCLMLSKNLDYRKETLGGGDGTEFFYNYIQTLPNLQGSEEVRERKRAFWMDSTVSWVLIFFVWSSFPNLRRPDINGIIISSGLRRRRTWWWLESVEVNPVFLIKESE